jgi:hypothetical protein
LEGEVNYPAATDTTIEIAGVNRPIAARIARTGHGTSDYRFARTQNGCVDRQGPDGCRGPVESHDGETFLLRRLIGCKDFAANQDGGSRAGLIGVLIAKGRSKPMHGAMARPTTRPGRHCRGRK